MKLLITGASGRVGRALVQGLAGAHRVAGLDRRPAATTHWLGDLGDTALLRRALQGVDAVLHAAALHAPQVGQVPDAEFDRVNVHATRQLAELAAEAGVGQFVYTSTTALYGAGAAPGEPATWVDETTPPRPRTVYHRSKLAAEQLLGELAQAGAFGLTVLRMGRCFPEPAPAMAAARLHRGVDVRDVVQAHALALASATAAEGLGSRCFVISGATPFQPADAAALAADAPAVLRQRAPALVHAFARRGWPLPARIDRVYCSDLAQQQLGWRPQHGFGEVLRQLDAGAPEVLPPTATAVAPARTIQRSPEACT